ncbi:MAG: hypothetical protein DWQ36_20875 [Acidobacteria bacterium]|nr:MAG: hypothetical protein DWQ30_21305 [Acidobacteriota bacterium]REK03319.1 MAG: hypothetical protein DWQ36_20875 [Acidobacteriota bacterium]
MRGTDHRVVWPDVLPADSYFGRTVCAARGTEYAHAGAPNGPGRAELAFDGQQWFVDARFTSPVGSQPYACARDGDTAGMVRALLRSDGTYSVYAMPSGDELIGGIDGGEVDTLAKSGPTLVVGQPDYGVGGRVTIYEDNQQFGWLAVHTIEGTADQDLGASLALRDHGFLFVGAPGAAPNGEVQTWVRLNDGSWVPYLVLTSPAVSQSGNANFGAAVAADGDLVAIGSPRWDRPLIGASATDQGTVYLYRPDGLGFALEATVRPPESQPFDYYGDSLDLEVGDSGRALLVVGAPREDVTWINTGAAYVWSYDGTSWRPVWRLIDTSRTALDRMGEALSLTSNGGVLVGSPNWNANGVNDQGAVVFFDLALFRDGFESGNVSAWSATTP